MTENHPTQVSHLLWDRHVRGLTRDVAQKLLPFWRRKFRNPVVLASCRGRPIRSVWRSALLAAVQSYMEAISAKERTTKNMPMQVTRNIQMPPAVPPFIRDRETMLVEQISHSTGSRTGWRVLHESILPSASHNHSIAKNGMQTEVALATQIRWAIWF
jgi:hypothetical protein